MRFLIPFKTVLVIFWEDMPGSYLRQKKKKRPKTGALVVGTFSFNRVLKSWMGQVWLSFNEANNNGASQTDGHAGSTFICLLVLVFSLFEF